MEGTPEDATIQFDFRASTPATLPLPRESEGRTNAGEDRRVELKKFSLRLENMTEREISKAW